MSAHENAEQSVLGGCMLADDAYWRIADLITETDLSNAKHRLIFRAISELAKAGQPCDAVTMGEWFDRQGLADLAGGFGYILHLANSTPSAANIRAYAEIVAKHSQHRRVLDAGAKIAKVTVDDSYGQAHRILGAVARSELATIRPARDVMADFVQDLQTKCDAESDLTGLSTGFPHMDEMIAGLQPGDLIIVAGRPSMGKTTFAQNVAENVALTSKRVLFFTMEMTAPGVLARSVASIGGVSFKAIRSPKSLEPEQWNRVFEAAKKLKESGLLYDESCGLTVEQICARARQCHGAAPLSLIVIDYLQFIKAPRGDTMALSIQEITRELKSLAKALNIPIILISQLNRDVEKRADRRPIMADLRESGAIEQDADLIIFLYRDGYYNADSPHKGFAEAIIAKQRQGEVGKVIFRERLDQMRFEECDGLPEIIEAPRPSRGLRSFNGAASRGKDAASGR